VGLNSNEQLKLDVIGKVLQQKITRKSAQQILNVSERTLRRYVKAYEEDGPLFVKHGNWKNTPANKTLEPLKEDIIALIQEKYYDFNRKHASEKLNEVEGIPIGYDTLNRWCNEKKILTKKANKRKRKKHYRRNRMKQKGLMIQMDGSPEVWFGLKKHSLVIAIDDADGEIIAGNFAPTETTFSCMNVIKDVLRKRGIFNLLYVDKAGIFGSNHLTKFGVKREGFSQLRQRLQEQNIQVIHAHSAQAKGRVERAFNTLQDRLIPEMRLAGIRNIKEANKYFNEYFLPEIFNKKYTVTPESEESAFIPILPSVNIDELFYRSETRVVRKDHTISFKGKTIDLEKIDDDIVDKEIELRFYPDESVRLFLSKKELYFKENMLQTG
jgi:transposase